jgi:hypothetical protein
VTSGEDLHEASRHSQSVPQPPARESPSHGLFHDLRPRVPGTCWTGEGSLTDDVPSCWMSCAPVLAEWSADRVLITHEMEEISPHRVASCKIWWAPFALERVSHSCAEAAAQAGRATVRTGDTVPIRQYHRRLWLILGEPANSSSPCWRPR